MAKGKLFVISGPSGVGKGTICKRVLDADSNMRFSVSMTTRAPREGEVEGVDYFFVGKDEFEELLREGQLLEYNQFVENYYGTGVLLEEAFNTVLPASYDKAVEETGILPWDLFVTTPEADAEPSL